MLMARRHRKTYDALHADPVRANISWDDAITMLEAFGATVTGTGGSMHSVEFDGASIVLHRPHPGNELPRDAVRRIRNFLGKAGVNPDDL